MRPVKLLVVHCSATAPNKDIGAREINAMHMARPDMRCKIGYHYVIRRNGALEPGRAETEIGAHSKGHNANSIGICLVGGVDERGKSVCNFEPAQYDTLRGLLKRLEAKYPGSVSLGHRDLSPDVDGDGVVERHEWLKDCPCFDVKKWLRFGVASFA